MVNDLVKNILIKFKVDDREIKKIQEGLSKGSSPAGQAGQSPMKNLPDSVRQILQMSREMDKVGMKMNKSFENMAKAAKSIAKDYLRDAERQLDQISRKAENRIRALERMQRAGASTQAVERMQARVTEALGAAQSKTRDIRDLSALAGMGGGGGRIGMIAGMLPGMAGGAAIMGGLQAPSQIAGMFQSAIGTSAQANAVIGSELVRRRTDTYQANLLNSIMNVRNRQDVQAKQYSDRQVRAETTKKISGGLFGLALSGAGIWGGAKAGAAIGGAAGSVVPIVGTGVGAAVGGILGGIGGAMLGSGRMSDTWNYFAQGGKETFRTQQFQDARDKLQAQSIDPYLYQRFRENSPAYSRANRLLDLNNQTAMDFRGKAFAAQVTGSEAYQMATSLRPEFGAAAGLNITEQILSTRRRTGFDASVLQGIMGQQAKFGVGGPKEAQSNFEKIMTTSFAKGVEDSGLLEKMAQLVTAYQSTQTVTTDSGRIAQQIMSGIGPGQENNIRAIEAAVGAQKRSADMYQEGGFRGFKKMQMAGEITRQLGVGGPEATDFQIALSGLGYEEGRRFLEERGAPSEVLEKYDKFQFDALVTTPSGKKAFSALDMKRASGEQPSDAERKAAQSALIASGYTKSTEVASAAVERYLNEGKIPQASLVEGEAKKTAAATAMEARMSGKGGTAEEMQEALGFEGLAKEDKDIQANVRQNMDAAIKLFREQAEAAKSFGEGVSLSSEKVKELDEALGRLVEIVNSHTSRMRGGASAASLVGNSGGTGN